MMKKEALQLFEQRKVRTKQSEGVAAALGKILYDTVMKQTW